MRYTYIPGEEEIWCEHCNCRFLITKEEVTSPVFGEYGTYTCPHCGKTLKICMERFLTMEEMAKKYNWE